MDLTETHVRESLVTDIPVTQVSWGAIVAGWTVAAGVAWLLYQLGMAIGLTVADRAQDPQVIGKGFSAGAGAWILLTWMASLFSGGWFAGRMAGARGDARNGSLHGLAVWGLTAVISIVVGLIGIANVAQGGAALLGSGVSLGANLGAKAQDSDTAMGLQAEIKQAISQGLANNANANVSQRDINQAIDQLDGQALSGIATRLLRGDTEGAKNMIALNTNLNRQQVEGVVNGLAAQVPQYREQAKQAAQQATRYSAAALWVAFVSTLLALAFAMWGGAVGARRGRARYDSAPQNY